MINEHIDELLIAMKKPIQRCRISSYNYERLAKLGDISWDFDDALTLVLDHWDKTKGDRK
jgi:hypothetical protein